MKKISESIWANSIKRSNTEEVRKEDNVDNFSFMDFFEYLNDRYEGVYNDDFFISWIKSDRNKIYKLFIPIIYTDESGGLSIIVKYDFNNNLRAIQLPSSSEFIDICKKICNIDPLSGMKDFKDGSKISNTNLIRFINFILNELPEGKKLLKRK